MIYLFLEVLLITLFLHPTQQTSDLPVRFVISEEGESHSRACMRNNLYPTSRIIPMEWNVSMLSSITNNLPGVQKSITGNNGINGCCAKGMWCNQEICFTGSYGEYFENYGWLNVDSDFVNFPVYSCYSDGNVNNDAFLFPDHLYLNDDLIGFTPSTLSHAGDLIVYGENFGYDDKAIELEIGPQKCSNVEVCGDTCRQCESFSSCPPNSLCVALYDGERVYQHCLSYCNGVDDDTCPCDSVCQVMTLRDEGNAMMYDLPLCVPTTGADTCLEWLGGDAYHTFGDPSKFMCKLGTATRPAAQEYTSGGMIDMDIGVTQAYVDIDSYSNINDASLGVANAETSNPLQQNVYEEYQTIIPCVSDDQCVDGDACTVHKCTEGYCQLDTIIDVAKNVSCHSSSRNYLDRNRHHAYLVFRGKGNGVSNMLDNMKQDFAQLDTKQGSEHTVNPHFKNTPIFFGSQVPSVSFHPGYIALTPIKTCVNDASNVGPACLAYSSDSNTIGFFMDYIDVNHPSIEYYTYTPSAQDAMIPSNDPDYLIDSASLFMSATFSDTSSGGTTSRVEASASLFSDGGVRIAYKDTSGILKSRGHNYFGLWASKQHSLEPYESLPRKNKEILRVEDVEDDTVFVWCPIDGTVCLPQACAQANQNLTMKWIGNIPKCKAVGELEWNCYWLGVASTHTDTHLTTPATFYSLGTDNYVQCSVPILSSFPYEIETNQTIVVELRATAIDNDYTPYLNSQVHPSHVVHTLLDDGSSSSEYWNSDTAWQRTLPVASPIMVRYFSLNDTDIYQACLNTQGCSALSHHTGYTCKSCGECAPGQSSDSSQKESYRNDENAYAVHITDCNNDCFGAAYKNKLNDNQCEGGLTGINPTIADIAYGTYNTSRRGPDLMILLFMLFIFSSCVSIYTYHKGRRIMELAAMNRRNGRIISGELNDNEAFMIINARTGEVLRVRRGGTVDNNGNDARGRTESSGLNNSELEMISIHVWGDSDGGKNSTIGNTSRSLSSAALPTGRDRNGDKPKKRNHVGASYAEISQGSDSSSNSSNADADADADIESGHGYTTIADTPRNEIDECTICLERFVSGDNYRRFPSPCDHCFHVNCIDEWLKQQDFCPLCKRSVRHMVFGVGTDQNRDPNSANRR